MREVIEPGVVRARPERFRRLGEEASRPTAVGKKNGLCIGSAEAGMRSGVMYTLLENCRLHGVEPCTYFQDVLARLPTTTNQEVGQLTPRHWKLARRAAVLPQAA